LFDRFDRVVHGQNVALQIERAQGGEQGVIEALDTAVHKNAGKKQ
jgi:hypothetical protein